MPRRTLLLLAAAAFLIPLPMDAGPPASTRDAAAILDSNCSGPLKDVGGIALDLTVDDSTIAPGAVVTARAAIHAWADLENVRVSLAPEGELTVLGSSSLFVGSLAAGSDHVIEIPVQYGGAVPSAMVVTVEADGPDAGAPLMRRQGLYTVFRGGRAHAAMGGYVYVELMAIREEAQAGQLSPEDAALEIARVSTTPVIMDQDPARLSAPGAFAARPVGAVPVPVPAVPSSGEFAAMQAGEEVAGTSLTVQGLIQWTDENGTLHPCYGCWVQVRDDELIGSELVADAITDTDGQYSFVVDNDDGLLQGGRDIFVRVILENGAVGVRPAGGGDTYRRNSGITENAADGAIITENFTWDNNGTNSACGVLVGTTYIAAYTYFLNGNAWLPYKPVEWPGGSGSFYAGDGSLINVGTGDRWDWDVIHHEYGHYVMDYFNIENNPGGPHSSANCNADVRPSKDEGMRLAWGEGWPTYFGTAGQAVLGLAGLGVPRVGDTGYADLEDATLQYDLENQFSFGGDDNERAVMTTYWDLFDAAADGRDNISVDHLTLFNRINAVDPTIFSTAWAALRAPLSNSEDLAYGMVAADHLIGPDLIAPAASSLVTPTANRNFSWNRRVGCGGFVGNSFDLVFYNASTFAKVLTIPGLGSPSHMLTDGQLATLAPIHDVLWAVEGRNTSSPATGPYLGENFAITVNRPPVADAGSNQSVECASHTGTSVQLNGTGSSDPDGDALTYEWSATGITFDNANSATPTATFPLGSTVVTLTVDDGYQTDEDQVTIQVVDTTPPDITCPVDITVECTEHGGTPATDPAIAAFLSGASATDICDPSPAIGDDAPGFFPVGTTPVTFTATDGSNNSSSCIANVNVVDTTPPVITVELDREVLWPPNHKMATIEADVTVTDICDPNPTFVLTSIVSSEPDNGLGDGDTANDIQDADYGTSDVDFSLRSERQGGNAAGRKYTITYTASDASGNTAQAVVCVRVPHDRGANALAFSGFAPAGGIDPGAAEFVLAVLSTPKSPVSGMDTIDEGSSLEGGGEELGGETVGGELTGAALDDGLIAYAGAIDPRMAMVGNLHGFMLPLRVLLTDVDHDGDRDALFAYSTAQALALAAASSLDDGPVGFRYELLDGRGFLLGDVGVPSGALAADPAILAGAWIWDVDDPLAAPAGPEGTLQPADDIGGDIASEDPVGLPGSELQRALVHATALEGARPNPFAGTAAIDLSLAQEGHVDLGVYDVRGARVRTLASGRLAAGAHTVTWDGRDDAGRLSPRGVYFIRMTAGSKSFVRKALLMP